METIHSSWIDDERNYSAHLKKCNKMHKNTVLEEPSTPRIYDILKQMYDEDKQKIIKSPSDKSLQLYDYTNDEEYYTEEDYCGIDSYDENTETESIESDECNNEIFDAMIFKNVCYY